MKLLKIIRLFLKSHWIVVFFFFLLFIFTDKFFLLVAPIKRPSLYQKRKFKTQLVV